MDESSALGSPAGADTDADSKHAARAEEVEAAIRQRNEAMVQTFRALGGNDEGLAHLQDITAGMVVATPREAQALANRLPSASGPPAEPLSPTPQAAVVEPATPPSLGELALFDEPTLPATPATPPRPTEPTKPRARPQKRKRSLSTGAAKPQKRKRSLSAGAASGSSRNTRSKKSKESKGAEVAQPECVESFEELSVLPSDKPAAAEP